MGRNGEWKKQNIIVETDGQYPKKVCISIWGDKINPAQLQTGNRLTIEFDLESREFNGKWYTDAKAWKIEVADAPAGMPGPMPQEPEPMPEPDFSAPPLSSDDLPF